MWVIGLTDLSGLPGILTPPGRILEPLLEREGGLSEIFLANEVFVPGDELDDGKFIYQRKIDVEIKGRIVLWKGWIQRLFDHTCLVSNRKA